TARCPGGRRTATRADAVGRTRRFGQACSGLERRLRTLEANVVGQNHEGRTGVEVDEDQGATDVLERVANRTGGLTGQTAAVMGDRANRAAALSAERSFDRLGVRKGEAVEAEEVADWEVDENLARALAALEARCAAEPADPILDTLKATLVRHLRARAGDGS